MIAIKYRYGKECEVCKTPFPPGVKKRACSDECKKKLMWRAWNCQVCGKEMLTRKSEFRGGKTCSIECGIELRRQHRPPAMSACKVCGNEFRKVKRKVYCSEECSKIGRQHDKPCPYCGFQRSRIFKNGKAKGAKRTCGRSECAEKRIVESSLYGFSYELVCGEWADAMRVAMRYLKAQVKATEVGAWKRKCINIVAGNRLRAGIREVKVSMVTTENGGLKKCLFRINSKAARFAKKEKDPWFLKMETLARNLRRRQKDV